MAVAAIHPQLPNVNVVRERNWLNRLITLPHVLGRQIVPVGRRGRATKHKQAKDNLNWEVIRPAGKQISHSVASMLVLIGPNIRSRIRESFLFGG
jgi:hypothetical protein